MNFPEDDIAAIDTEKKMRELESKGVKLEGGAEYNRVFEAIYYLYQRIEELENKISSKK